MKKRVKRLTLSKDTLADLEAVEAHGGYPEWTRPVRSCAVECVDTLYPLCQIS